MTALTLEFAVPPADVNTVHHLLEEVWSDAPLISARERFRFETALIELASNVIRHADGGDGLECVLTVEVTEDSLRALLIDSGVEGHIDFTRGMPSEDEESGRGIPLIQALVDRLEYSRDGGRNRWEIQRIITAE
jgi:serine/threonine-protein kinase RsbW